MAPKKKSVNFEMEMFQYDLICIVDIIVLAFGWTLYVLALFLFTCTEILLSFIESDITTSYLGIYKLQQVSRSLIGFGFTIVSFQCCPYHY